MEKPFRIRDPVHNFLELVGRERKLIGTRLFQRLRGIRQLAMENLVYPGALHTRFDHSMGVCHVAGRMADALELNAEEDEVGDVRLAALLHDTGHGPFSHVSEYSLGAFAQPSAVPAGTKRTKIHELVTARLLERDTEIKRIVGEETLGRVLKLLAGKGSRPAMRSIVSGPLDADKQDYLLRDSRFCGVPYGLFDLEQLHRSFMIGGEGGSDLAIRGDGLHAVEQFALAKYYMTANVYRHKVRLITDQMLARAVKLGIEHDGNPALRKLYAFDGSESFLSNYVEWDDARFLHEFSQASGRPSLGVQLVARLRDRRLFRRVFRAHIASFAPESRDALSDVSSTEEASASLRAKLERAVADVIVPACGEVDHRFVIVHGYTIPSVRVTAKNDSGGIMVHDAGSRTLHRFDEKSSLFRSIDGSVDDKFVDVYAPVEWESHAERDELLRSLHRPIFETINSVASPSLFGEKT